MITFIQYRLDHFQLILFYSKMSKNKKNKIVEAEVSINDLEN